jgi:hypothetical protein
LQYNHSTEALLMNCAQFAASISEVTEWYTAQHQNVRSFDGMSSKWKLFEQSKAAITVSVRQQQNYFRDVRAGVPASINSLCLTPAELRTRLGHFQTYCPVKFVSHIAFLPF